MFDDNLESVLLMVERAFVRIEAEDVLATCLQEESAVPLQKLVEGLILAGPASLNALREIRAEVISQRAELQGEIARIFSNMEEKLKSWGVNLTWLSQRTSMSSLEAACLGSLLRQEGIQDESQMMECSQLLNSSKEAMSQLARRILLLNEVDRYLEDWIWGLMYQSARQRGGDSQIAHKNTHYCQ